MNAPDSTPPDYAGLSKQEVAERLKNPTPDATATPRTIEQAAQDCLTNLECNNYGFAEASAVIASAMREVVERELSSAQAALTAAKAEIARLNENLDRLTCASVDARARVADLENDLEKSKHDADDWHRAWETVTEQAKKEVAELEQALSDCATKAAAEYGEQLKPLFAKVRELEQDKARLIDSIDVEALDAIANELTSFADSARAHSLMSVAARQRAAIDAARDGKGAA